MLPPGIFVGTCGWSYRHWRAGFYRGVPQRAWLAHCGRRFTGLEIDSSFYRLPTADTLRYWVGQVPEDFGFALKGSRFITHRKRLRDPEGPVAVLRDRVRMLGPRLRAVLWQLPAGFGREDARLEDFLAALAGWPEVGHVLEFRHPDWFCDAVAARLQAAGVGVCLSDAPDWPAWEAVTGPLVYCRLHGRPRLYASAYDARALDAWADRVRAWHARGLQVHVYFDNDAEGAAPEDALGLLARLRQGGGPVA